MGRELSDQELNDAWTGWSTSKDPDAREKLLCHYLSLVEFLANRLGRHVPPSYRPDLFGFGAIGLMDALDKFKPELGFRFETYSSRRIRGAMSDGMRTLNWLPRGAKERASRVIETIIPIDFQTAHSPSGVRLEDCLSDPMDGSALEMLELRADHEEVVDALKTLPEREKLIVHEHYYKSRRLAEIGVDMGITESRVCQLHRRALRMLQEALTANEAACSA